MPYLYLDLEFGKDGRFHGMAAARDEREQVWQRTPLPNAIAELERWVQPGDVLVGHNLHRFDLPELRKRLPGTPLLQLPAVDTLPLSVLAFPQRPFHRLTKDDRLVRDATPAPLSDVRACRLLLTDATAALTALPEPDRALLCALLSRLDAPAPERLGWQQVVRAIGGRWDPSTPLDLAAAWAGKVCTHSPLLRDPTVDRALLLVSAWLRIADLHDGHALPAWVRRSEPHSAQLVADLRATPCDEPRCAWCTEVLRPEYWLRHTFGFDQFRATPALPDGRSLQRELVALGLRGEPCFGILPTGGGKSLCFQVPARARHRLRGQLTVVISPLQSLMKDQVDALHERIPDARAIYGGLPSLLRPKVMDEVRDGSCGLLYLSPEQLRNNSIVRLLGQRELGAIVFDEAHCLSQWGHDFRTDYPYVLRAVRELCEGQGAPMPPVFLFTATTQADATEQILSHVELHTGRRPLLLDGGSHRHNLRYEVHQVPASARVEHTVELLHQHLGAGTAIVFCGSRKRTERLAQQLTDAGYPAQHYHAGLDPDTRRKVQDAFLNGAHRIITATNAFGMGIDKPDVRLVVHADMPSSLEAYLQEAGRAGRDGEPATAVLLWAEGDAEDRFRLGGLSDLQPADLQALWRAIKRLPAAREGKVKRSVVTATELLHQEAVQGHFSPTDDHDETRIKSAVNWLERAAVLERRENVSAVFSGRPLCATLAEAKARVDAAGLPAHKAAQFHTVLAHLYDHPDDGLSADHIAVLCGELRQGGELEGGLRVLEILLQLVKLKLVSVGQAFTAVIAVGVVDSSERRLRRWHDRELRFLKLAETAGEDSDQLHLSTLARALGDAEHPLTISDLARLLDRFGAAREGLTPRPERLRFARHGDYAELRWELSPASLREQVVSRYRVAAAALGVLTRASAEHGNQVLVSSELERLVDAVEGDLFLRPALHDPTEAVRAAVGWMHDLRVITVQNGLAVFRSAMTLRRDEDATLRSPSGHQAVRELGEHQAQRILRVHVMNHWAATMLTDRDRAEKMRADWFQLGLDEFRARWFPRQQAALERPTTAQSYEQIVTALHDPDQQRAVTADVRKNHLVLAGPGSGKTRILVHRVAWLLRVKRVPARQIAVVCYTRNNALELRRRLRALVGDDARHVTIQTLHAIAMRLVGDDHDRRRDPDADLDDAIRQATALLLHDPADPDEQGRVRDALLSGIEHLLVDEYQDLDHDKYALLCALTGRAMAAGQRKLRLFAVGDDDQSIFAHDGATTEFIQRFKDDYEAEPLVIAQNYRNPRAVLDLAQALLAPLPGRMKAGAVLRVNDAREADPPAGHWMHAHPELRGHLRWLRAPTVSAAASALMSRLARWIADGVPAEQIAVLTRNRRAGLFPLRLAAEQHGVPFTWPLGGKEHLPVGRVREITAVFDLLRGATSPVSANAIDDHLRAPPDSPWRAALRQWLAPHDGATLPAEHWRYDLLDWIRQERRARTLGHGIHLGTMHSAKGLEFEHVVVFDEGALSDDDRRLLYVALTRARSSLQLVSASPASRLLYELRHPLLDVEELPALAADGPPPRAYGLIGRGDLWIDWLGRQGPHHEGHAALAAAEVGDPFSLVERRRTIMVVDAQDRAVARLSADAADAWRPRLTRGLRLRLAAVLTEHSADPARDPAYAAELLVDRWHTAAWEARWTP